MIWTEIGLFQKLSPVSWSFGTEFVVFWNLILASDACETEFVVFWNLSLASWTFGTEFAGFLNEGNDSVGFQISTSVFNFCGLISWLITFRIFQESTIFTWFYKGYIEFNRH